MHNFTEPNKRMRNMDEELKNNNQNKKGVFNTSLLVIVLLSISVMIFGVLCIYNSAVLFLKNNPFLFSVLVCLFCVIIDGVCVWLIKQKKEKILKSIIGIFAFAVICLVLLFILQVTGFIKIIKDQQKLQAYIQQTGAWMPIVFIVLQYLQVVVLPIPSVVGNLIGVALFGPFKALIYSLIGIYLGSFTAFFIGRKLGYKAAAWLVGEEELNHWQQKLKGKDNLILTMMFIMPAFPDDILCFIAGLSSMTTGYFTGMIFISRIFSVTVTCYSIDLIPINTWWGLLLWGLIFGLAIIIFAFIYKNLDKIQSYVSQRKERNKNRKKTTKK